MLLEALLAFFHDIFQTLDLTPFSVEAQIHGSILTRTLLDCSVFGAVRGSIAIV